LLAFTYEYRLTRQLDGGRIGGAISPYFLLGGMGVGGALIFNGAVTNPIFYLVMLSGGFSTYERFFGSGTHESYYRIPNAQKVSIAFVYSLLIAGLLGCMAWNKKNMKSLGELRAAGGSDGGSDNEIARRLEGFANEWGDDDSEQLALKESEFIRSYFDDSK